MTCDGCGTICTDKKSQKYCKKQLALKKCKKKKVKNSCQLTCGECGNESLLVHGKIDLLL